VIQCGFVYLAVILGLFALRAVGNAVSSNIDTTLCLKALRMVIAHRNPPKGIIHHSDRGVQYASHDYVEMLLKHGFRISMSRKGNPYDNATAESFIKTLKTEEVYLWEYRTLTDAQIRLPFFTEEIYNRKRLHSSLGYRPPFCARATILNYFLNYFLDRLILSRYFVYKIQNISGRSWKQKHRN